MFGTWKVVRLAALAIAAAAAGCGSERGEEGDLAAGTSDARRGGGAGDVARYEIAFMEGMIDHHAMGIEMAQPCTVEEAVVHPELRALCEGIVVTQGEEIELMLGWLRDWYGVEYEAGAGGGMAMGTTMPAPPLAGLTGAELEIAFLRAMIPHHMQAVMQARTCLSRASPAHVPLLQLCDDIVTTQSAEIAQMRTWLCEWYGSCGMMGGGMGGDGAADPMGRHPMGGRGGR